MLVLVKFRAFVWLVCRLLSWADVSESLPASPWSAVTLWLISVVAVLTLAMSVALGWLGDPAGRLGGKLSARMAFSQAGSSAVTPYLAVVALSAFRREVVEV